MFGSVAGQFLDCQTAHAGWTTAVRSYQEGSARVPPHWSSAWYCPIQWPWRGQLEKKDQEATAWQQLGRVREDEGTGCAEADLRREAVGFPCVFKGLLRDLGWSGWGTGLDQHFVI